MDDMLRVVSVADAALDVAGMGADFARYVRERDPALLRFVPGARPTWFVVRRIPTSVFQRHVQTAATESERFLRAFAVGVARIEDLAAEDGAQRTVAPTGSMRSATGEWDMWTDRELEEIPPVYVEEIGGIAWTRSFLARSSGGAYPPPRMLVPVLEAIASRPAAQTRET